MFKKKVNPKSLPECLGFSERRSIAISKLVDKVDAKHETKSGTILELAKKLKGNELLYATFIYGGIIGRGNAICPSCAADAFISSLVKSLRK